MIIVDVEQGSAEWEAVRRGIPTASEFARIVTRKGALSASRDPYKAQLLTEWALDVSVVEWSGNFWTDRGSELEEEAMAFYAMERDAEPNRVGFVFRDEARDVGCSPDFLVGDDGLCEMKCPMPATHMQWWLLDDLPKDYWQQLQGQLWVTDRAWVDFLSYCPGLPPVLHRVEPDEDFQAALDKHMRTFLEEMEEGRERLQPYAAAAA